MLFGIMLLSSPLAANYAFAASDDKDKKPKLTNCLSSLGNLDSRSVEDLLKCLHDAAGSALSAGSLDGVKDAIRALIAAVTHEHDERKIADTNLQNQINHIQLIPGPQGPKGDKGDPATFSTQTCPTGQVMIGIKSDGTIICQSSSQTPADGTPCNDNNPNTINDVYIGGVCQGTASGQACTINPTSVLGDCRQVTCVNGQLVTTIDNSDLPSNNGNICVTSSCNNGVPQSTPAPSGTACNTSGGNVCDGAGNCVGQAVCGNGIVESGESCDDGALQSGDGCDSSCHVETGFACTGSPSVCSPICGDGLITGGEECDGANLGGQTCQGLGYASGHLSCTSTCIINESQCSFGGGIIP